MKYICICWRFLIALAPISAPSEWLLIMYLHTNCSVTINHSVSLSLVSEHHEPAVTSRNVFGVTLLVWLIFCEKSMLQTFSISRVVTVLILLKSLPKSLPISALYQHTFIRAMPRLWAGVLISAWMPWRFSLCLCVAPWQTDTVKDTLLHYSLLQRAEALWCRAAFLLCCWLMPQISLLLMNRVRSPARTTDSQRKNTVIMVNNYRHLFVSNESLQARMLSCFVL